MMADAAMWKVQVVLHDLLILAESVLKNVTQNDPQSKY